MPSRPVILALLLSATVGSTAAAQHEAPRLEVAQATVIAALKSVGAPLGVPSVQRDGAASFEMIKALAGEWEAPLGKDVMKNIFRPIAFGTAVLHEEWLNDTPLTATVFYMVGSELRADHFCDLKNQPQFVATVSTDPTVITFELREILNLDAHPRHFHSTTWHFVDATHLTQDWHIVESGKEPRTAHMEFTRRQ